MNNVYGYIRERGRTRKERNDSIDVQERAISEYGYKKGILITDWIRDRDVPATVPLEKRKNGARMCERLKPGDTILCIDPGAIFAHPMEALNDIDRWDKLKVKVHFVFLGEEIFPKYTTLLRGFLSCMAAEDLLARMQKSNRTKALLKGEGKITGGRPPYGFKVDDEGRSAFDPSKRNAINFMLEEFDDGKSYRWIGTALFTYFDENLSANAVQRTIQRFKDNPELLSLLNA